MVCIIIAFKQSEASESGNLQDSSFQEKLIYRGRKPSSNGPHAGTSRYQDGHIAARPRLKGENGKLILFNMFLILLICFIFLSSVTMQFSAKNF